MTLVAAQKAVAYATVVVSLTALGLTGVLGPVASIAMPVAVIGSWFWEPGAIAVERQRIAWNILLVAFIGLTAWQVFTGSAPVLRPAVDLVLVLLAAKLFQRAGARDYTQIYALTFLMMAVATVLEDRIHFGLVFVVYLVCCTSGFSLNQVMRQTEGSRVRPESIPITGRYLGLLAAMSVMLVAMSGAFFLVLPRVGIGMGAPATVEETVKMTGFADTIDLGDHGALGLDERVVMRVEANRRASTLYWRGVSFDRFDGRRWTASRSLKRRRGVPAGDDGWFELDRARRSEGEVQPERDGAPIEQRVTLEPIDADVIFGLPEPVEVRFQPSAEGQWDNVSLDRSGGVYHGAGPRRRVTYEVRSVANDVDPVANYDPEAVVPRFIAAHYLALPAVSPRVRRLAAEWTHGMANPAEMAQVIERRLATEYGYTLDLPARGVDPIDHFLFVDQRGHCEFFSTAMVVMLRSLGVPARNVNGFQGGEWNEVGSYYVVRRLNAHSWVEAWIPGAGWVRFDPTPEGALPEERFEEAREAMGPLDEWFDYLQRTWRGWVLDFDLGKQLDMLGGDAKGDDIVDRAITGIGESFRGGWWRWALLALYFLAFAFVLERARRGGWTLLAGMIVAHLLVSALWPHGSVLARLAATGVSLWLFWRIRVIRTEARERRDDPPLVRAWEKVQRALERHPVWEPLANETPASLRASLEAYAAATPDEAASPDPSPNVERRRLAETVAGFVARYGKARFGPAGRTGERGLVADARALARAIRSDARRHPEP